MNGSQSFLTSPEYGYDYVVAVTQGSVNAAAMEFLKSRQPVVSICYIYDDNGDPAQIDYEAFKKSASGADPFRVPAAGPERERLLDQLDKAGFMFGFQAAMGIPEGFKAHDLPPLITFGASAEDHAVYNLWCRDFLLVELNAIPHKKSVFETFQQPAGPQGKPWLFGYKIKIIPGTVDDHQAYMKTPAFARLPTATQTKVRSRPEDFTISHLLFDFNNAASAVRPEIEGVSPRVQQKLYADFSIRYFAEMEAAGALILTIMPKRDSAITNLKTAFSISPHAGEPALSTLNYLCVTPNKNAPQPKPFTWSWVDSVADGKDGVCVINRNDVLQSLMTQLMPYVERNCWVPQPVYEYVDLTQEGVGFGVVNRSYDWGGKRPPDLQEKLSPWAEEVGPLLFRIEYESHRENDSSWFHHGGGASYFKVDFAFDLSLECRGDQIVVTQNIKLHYHLMMQTLLEDTDLVDMTRVDTYTLAAAGDGLVARTGTPKVDDRSSNPQYWISVPELQKQMKASQAKVKSAIDGSFVEIPLSLLNGIIFPGGKAFLFQEPRFSEHQDLVVTVTYADPS
jgi:hypothetical protein